MFDAHSGEGVDGSIVTYGYSTSCEHVHDARTIESCSQQSRRTGSLHLIILPGEVAPECTSNVLRISLQVRSGGRVGWTRLSRSLAMTTRRALEECDECIKC